NWRSVFRVLTSLVLRHPLSNQVSVGQVGVREPVLIQMVSEVEMRPAVPFKEVASSIVVLVVDHGRFGPQRLVRVPRSCRPLRKRLLVGEPPKPTLDPCTQVWLVAMRRQTEPLGEVGQV